MYDDVRQNILNKLEEHGCDTSGFEDSTPVSQIPVDSLGLINMIADIEDHFRIRIPQGVQTDFDTLGDLVEAVTAKVSAEQRAA